MTESLYLISAVLFIFALKLFSRPSTAFRANNLAIGGMVLAIISAFNLKFADYDVVFYLVILVSAGLGVVVSNRVQMTQMPELVGIFNGLGGGASGAIAYVELSNSTLVLSDFSVAIFSMTIGGNRNLCLSYFNITSRIREFRYYTIQMFRNYILKSNFS